jgi:CelD/BcsL family acetyltransferase involved in cellulose biosynthesis
MTERVEWVTDGGRFEELAASWDALAASPFETTAWLTSWRRAFAPDDPLRVAVAWRGDELVGGLALAGEDGRLAPLANLHSPVFRPVAADAVGRTAVVRAALERGDGVLTLPAVPAGDPLVTGAPGGWRALSTPSAVSPIVETTGELAAWRAGSKPRWGAPLERFRRKMGRDHEASFAIVVEPEDLDATLRDGFAVEGSGWKAKEGTAILSSPQTAAFYRAVAEAFAARGELRTAAIFLDGTMVAFDLLLLHARRLYLLKTGFDEAHRRLAPGLVLRLSVIERCFELGLTAHELLGDRSEWKAKFATTERAHVVWTGYAPGLRGTRAWAYRRGGRELRRVGRAVTSRLARTPT